MSEVRHTIIKVEQLKPGMKIVLYATDSTVNEITLDPIGNMPSNPQPRYLIGCENEQKTGQNHVFGRMPGELVLVQFDPKVRSFMNPMGPWAIPEDFTVPEGFTDVSYSNDACPSIQCDATEFVIYCDTETNENAHQHGFFMEGISRFNVINSEGDTYYEGNNFETALDVARTTRGREDPA